jgi:FAD/FMN-containing dehydrogenase
VQQVEAFDLVGPDGEVRRCSRAEHADLFRLVIGGYGLFGIVARV